MHDNGRKNLGAWVLEYRWWVIACSLACVAIAASGGRLIDITTDYRVFFSPDNPRLRAFEALEKTYSKNDNLTFVLAPHSGRVFSRETLAAVQHLTERAWELPYSTRVDSVSNFQQVSARNDELVVGDLVVDGASLDDDELAALQHIALHEPWLRSNLISAAAHVTAVNVTAQLPQVDGAAAVPELARAARALADEVRREFPGIDVYLTGVIMLNNAFAESSLLDLRTLVPASFGVMVLMLVVMLRALWASVMTLLVIVLSIAFALGSGGWLGVPMTPPTVSAPVIILTMAVANCVHILTTFLREVHQGAERHAALKESMRVNLKPTCLASLTTALGFLSLNFSDAPPFRHLGNFVALGVVAAFALAVTLLPATMSLLPVGTRRIGPRGSPVMVWIGDVAVAHRRALLWGMTAITGFLVASITRNELNDVFVHYFDESVEFRRHADFTTENLTGLYQLEYSLQSGEPGGVNGTGYLKDVAAFAEWYRQQPEVKHVVVLTDVMKRLNKNMHAGDERFYTLPESRELAAQYLLVYEMLLPYGLDLNDRLDVSKSATRMTVSIATISSNEILALERRAQQWLDASAAHIVAARGSGTTLMFSDIGRRNITSMLVGTSVALVLISAVLIVALRSVKLGVLSLIPNLVPGAMGFGVWGLTVGEVGLSISAVTGMTLGIVVDDTVHFLSTYLRARREHGHSPADAVRYAFTTVGQALVTTSLVLAAGFLVLSLSSIALNSSMGLMTALVIMCALLADFLLLPPLLLSCSNAEPVGAVLKPRTACR